MKRILILSQLLPVRSHNGGSSQIRNLILAANNRGYKIDFISFNLPILDQYSYSETENFLKHNTHSYKVIPFEGSQKNFGRKGILDYYDNNLNNICKNLSSNEYDAIFAEFTGMAKYLKHFKKSIKFINIHELNLLKELREITLNYNIKDKIYLSISSLNILIEEIRLLREGDVILSYNEIEVEILKSFLRSKDIIHIPLTIEIPQRIRPINKRKYDFVFLGNFDHKPNRDAIEFILKNREKIIGDFSMLIGGRNTEAVKRFAGSMDNINFIEGINEPSEFLQNGKILIAPILSGGGSRVKIIEAMANGNLIISTPQGAEGLFKNEKEGIIILTKEEFTNGTPVEILRNINNYTHLIDFNRKNVESFHNISESIKIRELYLL